MTASEFADKHGIPYQTVVRWARKKLIPGVTITQFAGFKVYMIPADAEVVRPKTGRPTKQKTDTNAPVETAAAETTPANSAKHAKKSKSSKSNGKASKKGKEAKKGSSK